jgi:hypothetical protein
MTGGAPRAGWRGLGPGFGGLRQNRPIREAFPGA